MASPSGPPTIPGLPNGSNLPANFSIGTSNAGIPPELWKAIQGVRKGCYPDRHPVVPILYGYWSNLGAGIAFDVLFGLAVLAHAFQFARFRRWTSVLLALGALSE